MDKANRGRWQDRCTPQRVEGAEQRKAMMRIATAIAAAALVVLSCLSPASAQVSSADRSCITKFNKSIRKVVKTHGKIVKKCLKDFAAGRLTITPEACIASDPRGKLQRAVDRDRGTIANACAGGLPPFGVKDLESGPGRAVLNQFNLVHETVGLDLDINFIPSDAEASCQANVLTELIECEDTRVREYLKCLQLGLRSPLVTDATSLTGICLGTGNQPQPDGNYNSGRIAASCVDDIEDAIAESCEGIDLVQAFSLCEASDASSLQACLTRQSACQVCQLLNEVDNLVRDCDSMDDGVDNGSCEAECSDGLIHRTEGCDDGNGASGDGCSDHCQVEGGWTCTGEPSVCTVNCGNGALEDETCDDGDTEAGDGCSATCEVEPGYTCSGEPSVCIPYCGNGDIQTAENEACDDGDTASGDGCSSSCEVEEGWLCSGEPSVCTFECGNGSFQTGETCDDGDASGGDGCSAVCKIEKGWLCSGAPSLCAPICGDRLVRGIETCDDGDASSGDGCSLLCQIESGFQCAGQPSRCSAVCGDGVMRGLETCDDGNSITGDGCRGSICRQESDYACLGQPSICIALCGDGNLDGLEQCDDGNIVNGDGCAGNCTVEPGSACLGTPSLCFSTCGNGSLDGGEQCDDGNLQSGDGCSDGCNREPGWLCPTPGWPCDNFDVFIDSPIHGVFTTAGSVVVTGHYTTLPAGQVSVTVNGVPASSLNQTARTFSHTIPLSQTQVFNPVLVTLTNTANGEQARDRVVVIAGESVTDGSFSTQSGALRLNDKGLDSVEPLVGGLAAGQFDVGALMPPGSVVSDSCFIHFIGCLGSARVTIANPPPSVSALGIALDSKTNAVFADIDIFNLRVDVNIDGSGLVPNCGLRMRANAMQLTGDYALQPAAGSPSNVDVNLVSPIGVSFSGFSTTFTSGLCNAPIIGDIIQALLPDVQQLAADGIKGFLNDPDGSGPVDSPIADGIETTLAGISIAGPVGEGLGLMLDAPLFAVNEDNNGITLGSDLRFTTSVGSGPGQCLPPVGAPNFLRSYSKFEPFPAFGPTTPVGNEPYGLGICISTAGFNQLLRGQTECGLMRSSITSIDIDGGGPLPPVDINSSLLAALIPEFGQLPPGTPLRIDVYPTLAPIVTGNNGPAGALTELKIGQMMIEIVQPGPEIVWLGGALDARLGMTLDFLPDGSGLAVTITAPSAADLAIAILDNPLWTNQTHVEAVLPGVIIPMIPDLAGALSGFPLPQFFGLSIEGVEVSRNGQFLSLFANLEPGA